MHLDVAPVPAGAAAPVARAAEAPHRPLRTQPGTRAPQGEPTSPSRRPRPAPTGTDAPGPEPRRRGRRLRLPTTEHHLYSAALTVSVAALCGYLLDTMAGAHV